MVTQQIRKVGNSLVVTIPKAEADRLDLQEGDYISADYTKLEVKPVLDPEIRENLERNRDALTSVMRYLRDK